MKRILSIILLLAAVFPAAAQEKDKRLTTPPQHYNLPYHPWTPPATKEAWEARKPFLKEQLLVSQGLWPMPEKVAAQRRRPRQDRARWLHGRKGLLRQPSGALRHRQSLSPDRQEPANAPPSSTRTAIGKTPASPLRRAGKAISKTGAEATEESSKYFHQAGCAMLARFGCVVFHYDMVGNSDSMQIKHREGFKDVDAQLRLQTFMNLQTWNSVRAVDFLLTLARSRSGSHRHHRGVRRRHAIVHPRRLR